MNIPTILVGAGEPKPLYSPAIFVPHPRRLRMTDRVHQQSRLKALIAKGKEQGYLTYAEVNDHLPQDISDPDQVEDIIQMINDMGIQVFEQAPDADELLMAEGDRSADEIAAAEAAAALAAVEQEAGRTTDPCAHVHARNGYRRIADP
jgi:16S rRNA U1498 N3-methylase RsmE